MFGEELDLRGRGKAILKLRGILLGVEDVVYLGKSRDQCMGSITKIDGKHMGGLGMVWMHCLVVAFMRAATKHVPCVPRL